MFESCYVYVTNVFISDHIFKAICFLYGSSMCYIVCKGTLNKELQINTIYVAMKRTHLLFQSIQSIINVRKQIFYFV